MILGSMVGKISGNLKVKCESCKNLIKRKSAHFEKVKRLEFVHPKNTAFCNETCSSVYKEYEKSVPKRVSLCSSCPVPPAVYER